MASNNNSRSTALKNYGLTNNARPSAWEADLAPRKPVEADYNEEPGGPEFQSMRRAEKDAQTKRTADANRDIAEYERAIEAHKLLWQEIPEGGSGRQTRGRGQLQTSFSELPKKQNGYAGRGNGQEKKGTKREEAMKAKDRLRSKAEEVNANGKRVRGKMSKPTIVERSSATASPLTEEEGEYFDPAKNSVRQPPQGRTPRVKNSPWKGWVEVPDEEAETDILGSDDGDQGRYGRGKRARLSFINNGRSSSQGARLSLTNNGRSSSQGARLSLTNNGRSSSQGVGQQRRTRSYYAEDSSILEAGQVQTHDHQGGTLQELVMERPGRRIEELRQEARYDVSPKPNQKRKR